MNSCTSKNIFGLPGTGFHSVRIDMYEPYISINDSTKGLALLDIIGTIILAIMIFNFMKQSGINVGFISLLVTIIILFFIAELFHLLFCVETPITKYFS